MLWVVGPYANQYEFATKTICKNVYEYNIMFKRINDII